MSYFVTQKLYTYADQPSFTWRQDTVLNTPVLEGPRNQSNLCYETAFVAGTGVEAKWQAVSGANFYILQWCNNSSFTGPTLKAVKTASTSYELQFGTDIRLGEEIFWRVMAFNNITGAVSGKSEVWSFTYDCSELDGNLPSNQNRQPGGGGGYGAGGSLCNHFNVKIEIKGPKQTMCCDKNMWHLLLSFDCEDRNGNAVTMTGVTWNIEQAGGAINSILMATNNLVVITTSAVPGNASEEFTIHAVAGFVVGTTTFQCGDQFKVTVDCNTGKPSEKPWLKTRYIEEGIKEYTDPDYRGSAIGCLDVAETLNKPLLHCTSNSVIAVGPVIEVSRVYNAPPPPIDPCIDDKIDTGSDTAVIHEARIHIPLGCGLKVLNDEIAVDNSQLAGTGLIAEGDCSLAVDMDYMNYYCCGYTNGGDGYCCGYAEPYYNVGCGLEVIGDNMIKFDANHVAGSGLIKEGDCKLGVYTGCGLIILGDEVQVNEFDLAGEGLIVSGNCGLAVNPGCGIEIVSDEVRVKNTDLAGPGLSLWGDCGLQVRDNIYYGRYRVGCGLTVEDENNPPGTLIFNPQDVIEDGLEVGLGPCGIRVAVYCGLDFAGVDNKLTIKPSDLAGAGLLVDSDHSDCGLKVDCDYCSSYWYDIGCGLEVAANTITVNPADLAARGLIPNTGAFPCGIDVDLGCGLQFDVNDKIEIKSSDLAGPGLLSWSDCGLQIDCSYCDAYVSTDPCYYIGCGIKVVGGDTIAVDNSQLAGTGLIAEGDCSLAVDMDYMNYYCCGYSGGGGIGYQAGCGLTLNGNVFSVNPYDLAGDCLEVGASGCELKVPSTLLEVVTNVYCQYNSIYVETDIVKVLSC